MTNFEKVGLFMTIFKQEVKTSASLSSSKIIDLRVSLIEEELSELKEALKHKNLWEFINGKWSLKKAIYKN